ncbi:MAG: hypothetical protein RRY16_00230 [Bacilli bacterium]
MVSLKTKFLAGVLAMTIAGGTQSALALKKEDKYTGKTIAVEEQLKSDDIGLDDEYLAFLEKNDIKVVDGDIKVETVEQFKAIAEHFQKYLNSKNFDAKLEDAERLIRIFNKDALDYDLVGYNEKKEINYMFDVYAKICWKIEDMNVKNVTQGNDNDFIFMNNILFSKEARIIEDYYFNKFKNIVSAIKEEDWDGYGKIEDECAKNVSDDNGAFDENKEFSSNQNILVSFINMEHIFFINEAMNVGHSRLFLKVIFGGFSDRIDEYLNEISQMGKEQLQKVKKLSN